MLGGLHDVVSEGPNEQFYPGSGFQDPYVGDTEPIEKRG
jgi:hypothetical protein